MECLVQINQEVERIRIELYRVSEKYGLSSLLALEKSQELDTLLNQYLQREGGESRKTG